MLTNWLIRHPVLGKVIIGGIFALMVVLAVAFKVFGAVMGVLFFTFMVAVLIYAVGSIVYELITGTI